MWEVWKGADRMGATPRTNIVQELAGWMKKLLHILIAEILFENEKYTIHLVRSNAIFRLRVSLLSNVFNVYKIFTLHFLHNCFLPFKKTHKLSLL